MAEDVPNTVRVDPASGGARLVWSFKKGLSSALPDQHLHAPAAGRLLHGAAGAGAADAGGPGCRRPGVHHAPRPGEAPLHRPPHRPGLQGRRHPQHPAPAGRRRRRQHRHLRRRQGRGHHQDARRPLGPGAGRGAAPEAAGPGARRQPDPGGAAGRAGEGAGAGDRPAEADHRGAAHRDPPDRRVLRRRQEPGRSHQGPAVAAGQGLGRRAHQHPDRLGRGPQPGPGRGAGAQPRHPDLAGDHRGPHRRGPVHLRPPDRRAVGRHRLRGHRPRQPDRPGVPAQRRHRRRRHRRQHPDRRSGPRAPLRHRRRQPQLRRQPARGGGYREPVARWV